MKVKELQAMDNNALVSKLDELKQELFNLRFSHATNQLTNPAQLNNCKKDIARVKTVIRQREIADEIAKAQQK